MRFIHKPCGFAALILALLATAWPFQINAGPAARPRAAGSTGIGTGVTPPIIQIILPAAGQRVTNSEFSFIGSISVDPETELSPGTNTQAVYYSLNGSPWAATPPDPYQIVGFGSSSWAVTGNLIPGTNVFQAYGVDTEGNISSTQSVRFNAVFLAGLTVQIKGAGTLSTNFNGSALIIGQHYSITATPAAGWAFSNWTGTDSTVLTNGRTLAFTMASNLVLSANFRDVTPPTLAITASAARLAVSNAFYTINGTARDNVAVSNVLYSLNGSAWTPAATTNDWTNWNAAVTLAPGTNSLLAYAVDSSGNFSTTGTVSSIYIETARFFVETNQPGWGKITPDYSGTLLYVGKKYSITARPAAGFVFQNWSQLNLGNVITLVSNSMGQPLTYTNIVITAGPVLTNGATLSFMMTAPSILESGWVSLSVQTGYQANFLDVTPPALKITSPTPNQQMATNSFVIRGTASDNAAIASVWYQFNGGGWLNPVGTNHWSATVSPHPGTNTVMAYAVDTSGNASPTNTVNFVYVDKTPLTLVISGDGAVAPNYNGVSLQIGQNFLITAKAAAGSAFADWVSVTIPIISPLQPVQAKPKDGVIVTEPTRPPPPPDSGTILTTNPALVFAMSPGLFLEAVFVDIAPPRLTITAPTPNLRVTNSFYTVSGTAKDNVGVAGVYYQLNGGGWQSASTGDGWTNWFAGGLELVEFTNVVRVYAVDTSGNVSPTNTIRFVNLQPDPAPDSLADLEATVADWDGDTYPVAFGTNTFSQSNAVGGYSYTKLSPSQAVLVFTNTAPPGAAGPPQTVNLTFSFVGIGSYTDINGGGNITLVPVADRTPATLIGKKSLFISSPGEISTVAFGGGTLNATNGGGGRSEAYSFKKYSPLASLLVAGDAVGGTNYLLLTYDYTNYGGYEAFSYDAGGNFLSTNAGEFVLTSPLTAVPAPLANTAASLSFANGIAASAGFGSGTFSLGGAAEILPSVGAYAYSKINTTNALLKFTVATPPSNPNDDTSWQLNFAAPDFAFFTNRVNGTGGLMTLMPATNLYPASLAGRSVQIIYETDTVSTFVFQANGTFTQEGSYGTYSFKPYSPTGALIEFNYASPGNAGVKGYMLATFFQPNQAQYFTTYYNSSGVQTSVSTGTLSIY